MNRKNLLPIVLFVSVLIINISTILNGLKEHETWLIVIGSAGVVLMLIAGLVKLLSFYREKAR